MEAMPSDVGSGSLVDIGKRPSLNIVLIPD